MPMIAGLGERATILPIEQADRAFHVPATSGRRDADVLRDVLDRTASWMQEVIAGHP